MTKRIWHVSAYIGESPITEDVEIDFPIDSSLYRQTRVRPDRPDQASPVEDETIGGGPGSNSATGGGNVAPEILTDLTDPVGVENSSETIDVLLECTDMPGVVKYEFRLSTQ